MNTFERISFLKNENFGWFFSIWAQNLTYQDKFQYRLLKLEFFDENQVEWRF